MPSTSSSASTSIRDYTPVPLHDSIPDSHRSSGQHEREAETQQFLSDEEDQVEKGEISQLRITASRRSRRRPPLCLWIYTGFLLMWTAVLGWVHLHTSFSIANGDSDSSSNREKEEPLVYSPATSIFKKQNLVTFSSQFTGPHPFNTHTNYSGPPSPALDAAWDELTSPVYFTLTTSELSRLQSPTMTIPWPWNGTTGVHVIGIDVFHQLHCLNLLRKALSPEYYGARAMGEDGEWHVHHCVNSLRQSLMCNADVTPIYFTRDEVERKNVPELDVVHGCRDWEALWEWAMGRVVPESEFD